MAANIMDNAKNLKKDQSLSSMVYTAMKEKIINGDFMPGSVLMERQIADEFGISRTPVREAMKRLAQEGWVDWQERRRAVVSQITIEKILELFTLREMIEPFVIRKIIEEGHPQILAGQLAAVNADMEAAKNFPLDFMKYDMEFHTTIVQFMGLSSLNLMWQKIREDMTRLVMHSYYPRRDPNVILYEHKSIIDALWDSDSKKALEFIGGHFSVIVDLFKKQTKDVISNK